MIKNWSQFTIYGNFNASVQEIYDAWTVPHDLEKWFLRSADFFTPEFEKTGKHQHIRAGYKYTWKWHGFPDNISENGEVLEANGKDFLRFTFSGGSIVNVHIKRKESLTIIELTQENIPHEIDPEKNLYVQCSLGWTFYLANLKSISEGGIDLRNKNIELLPHFK
jgi:uncharacterized protein YndB with AHSA1/START domain